VTASNPCSALEFCPDRRIAGELEPNATERGRAFLQREPGMPIEEPKPKNQEHGDGRKR
jgi:hypothetical protein